MIHMTIQQQVNILWSKGYNPVKLFKNVYLVRHESTQFSKWPFYLIKIFRDTPLTNINMCDIITILQKDNTKLMKGVSYELFCNREKWRMLYSRHPGG